MVFEQQLTDKQVQVVALVLQRHHALEEEPLPEFAGR